MIRPFRQIDSLLRERLLRVSGSLAAASLLVTVGAQAATAQEPASKPQAPSINYRERPRFPFDPQRLKRRPTLDGMIAANEWDPLYTITDGAVKGTVYVNWDDDYFYVALRADQQAYLVLDIDANADGWLRGADNLELTVGPAADNTTSAAITARILDAAGSKDTPVWNDKVVDTRSIQAVQKMAGSSWMVELAIPKGLAGLMPRAGGTIALRADLLPLTAAAAPTAPYEPHLLVDVALVESRTVGAPGLAPRLVLDDNKLVPGQPLKATFELMNQTEQEFKVRSVTWQGDGAAAEVLNTLREVNVADVKGLKNLKQRYSSPLSENAVPGFYQMTVTALLENGKTVSSTTSFSVVDPFVLKMETEPEQINVLGPTQFKIFIDIASAVPGYTRGDVEIETPAGWDVKGRKRKDFFIAREDSSVRSPFYITLPSTTQAGDYIVNATVYWRGKTWKVHRNLKINRTTEAAPAPPIAPETTKKP